MRNSGKDSMSVVNVGDPKMHVDRTLVVIASLWCTPLSNSKIQPIRIYTLANPKMRMVEIIKSVRIH